MGQNFLLKRRLPLRNAACAIEKETFQGRFHWMLVRDIAHVMLLTKSSCHFAPLCRGGPPGTKCPVDISDLIIVYNYVNQELALLDKELKNETHDFWKSKPPTLKEKFCSFFALHGMRMKNLNPPHRITPIPEGACTTITIPCFILNWKKSKAKMSQQKKEPFTFQLQFLIAHEQEYNKNASILKTCDANPKTRYEIESMKSFILSYCLILLGSDLDWMGASKAGDGGCPVDPPVLAPANADDDDPESPEKAAAELGQQPAPTYGAKRFRRRL